MQKEVKQKECFQQLPSVACINLSYNHITSVVLVFCTIHCSSAEMVCLNISTYGENIKLKTNIILAMISCGLMHESSTTKAELVSEK